MAATETAILLIGFGGPTRMEEVRPFIQHVIGNRPVPAERIEEVVRHYERLGGRSPYHELTFAQGRALRRALKEQGCDWPVYVGFRHAPPFFEETLQAMASDGIRAARGFILAPHQCEASHDRYVTAVEQARASVRGAPAVEYVTTWHDHPLFIEAVALRVEETLQAWSAHDRAEALWLFTAHSIPVPMAQRSPYVTQLEVSARLVAERLEHARWQVAYQSRSGRPQEPWLEPSIEAALRAAAGGQRRVLVIPIGFTTDHVEVLFDLDVEAAALARELDLTMARAATIGAHPSFIRMMAEVVQRTVKEVV